MQALQRCDLVPGAPRAFHSASKHAVCSRKWLNSNRRLSKKSAHLQNSPRILGIKLQRIVFAPALSTALLDLAAQPAATTRIASGVTPPESPLSP
jgi:hypothetical protein